MFEPSIDWYRSIVSPDIKSIEAEQIKQSSTPAATYRLRLVSKRDEITLSLLVKVIDEDWPDDPSGHEREVYFYQRLLPKLRIPQPQVYFAGREPASGKFAVVMEDLGDRYRFPSEDHAWTQAEIKSILRTYARLHEYGQAALPEPSEREWMMDRHEKRLWKTAGDLPEMVEKLTARGVWPALPGFSTLLDWLIDKADKYSIYPVTVLHNDVYPPNCGLPHRETAEAVLLDWEMVGWGLAELDLGFMFLQPYGSHRKLDRQEALDFYWRERQRLGCSLESSKERQSKQEYADVLWALWLIPVAFRMVEDPFPADTQPKRYWDSMLAVLGERLQQYCHAL